MGAFVFAGDDTWEVTETVDEIGSLLDGDPLWGAEPWIRLELASSGLPVVIRASAVIALEDVSVVLGEADADGCA